LPEDEKEAEKEQKRRERVKATRKMRSQVQPSEPQKYEMTPNLPWTFNPLSWTVNQTSQHTSIIQNVVMFSGCRDEQTSAAGPTRNDLSQCTRVLIETLRGRTVGSVPVSELVGSMRRLLVASQDTQIPQLSMSRPPLLGALL
jgi:hypothetical protein